ncbi:EAL domain-containing protein [Massilia aquatica]|uniref:EAL domain-containing protein n=1 Tax=Massilia aquatica TaxID=2609000 RepID=A0ABX0MB23_9BURK|nr:EAL domain-containing protein [Massilia aquatica]NHZ39306.1 EAL domain-containing protein [Massilia aquatica]
MPFPTLNTYLAHLSDPDRPASSVWLDSAGRAQGKYFNCTITSAFQPIRALGSSRIVAYEGLARSASAGDAGLSLWKLLDHAASDDESIELDRLCRMLHAINFFRQDAAGQSDLYLNVHDRLLSAVSSNHGHAFKRILDALDLPVGRIVLQLPATTPQQGWLLNYVADNYRRNGFRLALNAASVAQAQAMVAEQRPHAIKLDARYLSGGVSLEALLEAARAAGVRLIFKRVESAPALASPEVVADLPLYAQGFFLDQPQAALVSDAALAA